MEESKETWPLNATCDSKRDTFAVKEILGANGKTFGGLGIKRWYYSDGGFLISRVVL